MPNVLPFEPSVPDYRFNTTLDDIVYILDVRWNARVGAWFFDLLDEEENMIRAGIKIVLGTLLGLRSAHADFPTGKFIAIDLANTGLDAGFDDLGDRVNVYYYTAEEVDEL